MNTCICIPKSIIITTVLYVIGKIIGSEYKDTNFYAIVLAMS